MFAAAIAALAEVRHFGLLCLILMVAGMAWITLMTSFNVATQTAVPSWIRARALGLYLLIFHGGMAAGSVLWGAVTQHAGVAVALFGAAGGLLVSLVAMAWYPFKEIKQSNSIPSTYRNRAARTYSPRVNFGWSDAGDFQLQVSVRHQEYQLTPPEHGIHPDTRIVDSVRCSQWTPTMVGSNLLVREISIFAGGCCKKSGRPW